ncbi:MAG: hypothetical protein CSB47_09475 [Proteobacteria bacterium]|nr:MAG: hypothetical protein CSB47_09475 [Pseudomonadota bacterium]
MELTILIIAAVGMLLFAISYLKFAYEGFRYHLITGLLALIPVVNLIALPTLWDRTIKMLGVGLVGLLIAIGAWFLGAGETFQSYWHGNRATSSNSATHGNTPIATAPVSADGRTAAVPVETNWSSKGKRLSLLPSKALYRLDFESAPPDQIKTFTGRIVRITSVDHTITDGRIQSVTPSSIFIEQTGDGQIAYEMMLSNIKSIKVMVRRAAR